MQSDAIRRNQAQSGAIRSFVFPCFGRAARACVLCFCVLGWHNGPVFCVFVFWQTPLKTQQGANPPTGRVACSDVINLSLSTARAQFARTCAADPDELPRAHRKNRPLRSKIVPYAIYGRFLTLLTSFSTSKSAKTVLLTFNKYNIDNNNNVRENV